MHFTGWYYADPLVSAGIGLFILPRTWRLLREAVGVLLEGTPADVNPAAVRESLAAVDGVSSVHDLHLWSLTSGRNALSVHVVVAPGVPHERVLAAIHQKATTELKMSHVTVQTETSAFGECESHL